MSAAPANAVITALADVLEQVLRGQLERHQALLECLGRKRQAIRSADLDAIGDLCRREELIVERLKRLDEQRSQIIAKLSAACRPGKAPLTLRELCAFLPAPRRSALEAIGEQLAATAESARRESSIVRAAADALGHHLGRLVNSVRTTLDRAHVYGRQGRLSDALLPVSLDLKT